jgi:hypothetical protein
MAITLEELKEYIKSNVNEVDILEHLNIDSEELVETFSDKIEDKMVKLIRELELTEDDEDNMA